MKLKTEIRHGDDMVVPIAAGDEFDQFNAYAHDAAYAHALIRSLAESRNTLLREGRSIEEWVEARADEIMAQWGYREE